MSGNTYATNDHVALGETVVYLQQRRVPILRLQEVVHRIRHGSYVTLPENFVCMTLDDGCDFDWREWHHPTHGKQPSMHSVLRKHSAHIVSSWWLRKVHATSFVIASPKARGEISQSVFGDPHLLSDDWWPRAQQSGLMDIGTHGWDHVHPAVAEIKERPELAEAFHALREAADVDLQMRTALDFIRTKAGRRSGRLFAYPYGQVNEFICKEYLPAQHEIWGAFTSEPSPLRADSNVWRLPRYVCGWHWKSIGELAQLLSDG